jgi:SAM-dependent methyltransferase
MLSAIKQHIKNISALKRFALFLMRCASPWQNIRPWRTVAGYAAFFRDLRSFRAAGGDARMLDFYPCLFDKTAASSIDTHYFHQAIWAFRHIRESATAAHVDIASQVNFVGLLTCITRVTFVDIRPLELDIPNYIGLRGSIVELPFADGAVESLSCLHVIEHIGLGRYGDPLDPRGPERAAREIARVLRAGGRAYISTPVGRPRVQFNGQRVFSIREVPEIFRGLALVEFSLVDARGTLREKIDPAGADIHEDGAGLDCGLGMFVFQKPA